MSAAVAHPNLASPALASASTQKSRTKRARKEIQAATSSSGQHSNASPEETDVQTPLREKTGAAVEEKVVELPREYEEPATPQDSDDGSSSEYDLTRSGDEDDASSDADEKSEAVSPSTEPVSSAASELDEAQKSALRQKAKKEIWDKLPAEEQEKHTKRKAEQKAVDKKARAELTNEGIAGYADTRLKREPPAPRPAQVEKLWRGMYPLVKSWWEEGGKEIPTSHKTSIKKTDDSLKKFCARRIELSQHLTVSEKETELKVLQGKYMFPTELLHTQIYSIGVQMGKINTLPSEKNMKGKIEELERAIETENSPRGLPDLQSKLKKAKERKAARDRITTNFLSGTLVFMDGLYKYGISPSDVISSKAMTMFTNFISSSTANQALFDKLKEELERPTLEQVSYWEAATLPVFKLVHCVYEEDTMLTTASTAKVDKLLADIKGINKQIQETNKSRGVEQDVNSIPISILNELCDQWRNNNREQVHENIDKLMVQLRAQDPAKELVGAIVSGAAPKHLTSGQETSEDVNGPSRVSRQEVSSDTERRGNTPPVSSGGLDAAMTTDNDSATIVAQTSWNDEDLLNFDLDSATLPSGSIEMFQYGDGKTEFGPLVATRTSSSDNSRFSRFVVNSGVEKHGWELFRVVKGSELAPGAADMLDDQKVVEFNLKQRKKELKSHPLGAVGPCIVMPRSDGYVPRGTKVRQPDTYIRVAYREKSEAEWLSRTEFIQLAGKRFADRQFATLIPAQEKRELYFKACRAQRKHPETKKSLTPDDLKNTPWLFPDHERSLFCQGDEEDNDTDGMDVDPLYAD
jgi:hypothetical protein